MWFWIVIYFFIQVSESETQIYYSTGNTRHCYDNPPSSSQILQPLSFCVECGCFETGLTEHILRCRENEVIRMEFNNNTIISRHFNHNTSRSCILIRGGDDYCYSGFSGNVTTADRIEVYRNCTLQNNCTITINPVEEGNVKLIRYPYVCERYLQDISKQFIRIQSNPVFYFKGIKYINKTIDCDCSVYNSSRNIEVEIFYIHGDNICNRLDILPDTDLINCTVDDIQLYTAQENIQSDFLKIIIRNMTVTGDEVVFFKVHGDNLNVTCTGCITRTESVTTPTTTLSTPILPTQQTTSTNLNTGRSSSTKPESTSGQTPSDVNLKTSSESTTTNHNAGQLCDSNLNVADFISRTEHEEKLNQTYAMFGGIIAGIIIINIVTMGIYCFISKRNKAGTSPESEYANTEFRLPDETESPQYQGLNL